MLKKKRKKKKIFFGLTHMLLHACKNVKRARYTGAAQTLWLLLKGKRQAEALLKAPLLYVMVK